MNYYKRYWILLTLIISLTFIKESKASHYIGGEITWECRPNGNFDFYLKLYRECFQDSIGGAASYPSALNIYSNSPEDTIPMGIFSGYPKQISPSCNSAYPQGNCASGNVQSNMGASELYFYSSITAFPNGVHLDSVPPASGWLFYIEDCCRVSSTNIANSLTEYFHLSARMYPYQNQSAYPCFDNAPVAAEVPHRIFSTAHDYALNIASNDLDGDVLKYEWIAPKTTGGVNIAAYTPPYTYNPPFALTSTNQNNIPVVLDSLTGNLRFKSFTSGAYVTSMLVSSYRNGIKISETQRDLQYIIMSGGTNVPPNITDVLASNPDPFLKVAYPNEHVWLSFSATDFQLHPNGNSQWMSLKVHSPHLGQYIGYDTTINMFTLSDSLGCVTPPCARLQPVGPQNKPLTGQFAVSTGFKWDVDCSHLRVDSNGILRSKEYYFTIHVWDDNCPVPAHTYKTLTVLVEPPKTCKAPNSIWNLHDAATDTTTLVWDSDSIDKHSFRAYLIYSSSSLAGPWILEDSISKFNIQHYSFVDTSLWTSPKYYMFRTAYQLCDNNIYISQDSVVFQVDITQLGDYSKVDERILVLPNPSNGKFEIQLNLNSSQSVTLRVVSMEGKQVYQEVLNLGSGNVRIPVNINHLNNGLYTYEIEVNGKTHTGKIILHK